MDVLEQGYNVLRKLYVYLYLKQVYDELRLQLIEAYQICKQLHFLNYCIVLILVLSWVLVPLKGLSKRQILKKIDALSVQNYQVALTSRDRRRIASLNYYLLAKLKLNQNRDLDIDRQAYEYYDMYGEDPTYIPLRIDKDQGQIYFVVVENRIRNKYPLY